MWNPSLYLEFGNERTRPCLDLVNRIAIADLRRIVDLGCGPGNSTAVLKARWPQVHLIGVDNSRTMLEQARQKVQDVEWIEADISTWRPDAPVDLIFSNAAFQWVRDHRALIPSLVRHLRRPGILAIQIPYHLPSPAHRAVEELCREESWQAWLQPPPRPFEILEPDEYYRLLSPLARRIDLWQTTYFHVLDQPSTIVQWMQGTGLRPYLDRVPDAHRDVFLDAYRQKIERAFPAQPDGRVLFPFPRQFFIAEL